MFYGADKNVQEGEDASGEDAQCLYLPLRVFNRLYIIFGDISSLNNRKSRVGIVE